MPTNKDLKRLVRRRMQKTGEAYTTARAQLLAKKDLPTPAPAPPAAADYARLAGVSDASVKAKTGCTWERWVQALDLIQAHAWPHRAIAEYVHEKYKVPGWWSQTVTVGYERIKGLRDIGQRRGGSYEAGKSKTFGVSVSRLYRACSVKRSRARWLPQVVTVRTARPNRSMRITWGDGSSVELWFTAKGRTKSQLSVQHRRLPDKAAIIRMKQFWEGRLGALEEMLAPAAATKG